jgi:hypothetical protein
VKASPNLDARVYRWLLAHLAFPWKGKEVNHPAMCAHWQWATANA